MKERKQPLKGKIALATGAGRRLGRAIASALTEDGADLLLHTHSSSGGDIQDDIKTMGRQAVLFNADLTSRTETLRLAQEAVAIFGRIDILVNNAAVFFPTPLTTLSAHTWRTVFHTNLTAPFLLACYLGRSMYTQKDGGVILQIADWSGLRPALGFLPYYVSKGQWREVKRSVIASCP